MSRGIATAVAATRLSRVTSVAIHILRGYGYRHALRDDAFSVPRLILERWAESGPIEGYEPGRTPC